MNLQGKSSRPASFDVLGWSRNFRAVVSPISTFWHTWGDRPLNYVGLVKLEVYCLTFTWGSLSLELPIPTQNMDQFFGGQLTE